LATSASFGRNEIETFIFTSAKFQKTTEKMLSVWFDIGATVPKLNSFRETAFLTRITRIDTNWAETPDPRLEQAE
jgi:hypothetical protein